MKSLMLFLLLASGLSLNAQVKRFTVAKDGSGNFRTVQEALDAVPLKNKKPVTILIKNGIYYEKLHLDSSKNFVTQMA